MLVAAVVVVVVLLSGGASQLPGVPGPAASLADPVPYDGRTPQLPRSTEQRVLVQFQRPALGDLPSAREMGAEAQLTHIKSLKREAIATRSALAARGVVLRDVVGFYRVWNGFAATVSTRDIPRLNSPGVRVRTVRRAYPASSEPVPVGKPSLPAASLNGQPPVAVLDTGVDSGALNGHADPGYDAVDRDRDPSPGKDPGGTKRVETSGTALASVVAALGERVLPIRVASLRAAGGTVEASSTTDELIAGLEHAVDPNGDGDTSDHVPVALVGVNAPYAGFANSPEAQAITGAAGLGTLVVAPAGNEGAGSGTVGSPGAARDALAVGALAGPEPSPRIKLQDWDAAALGGTPPKTGTTAGPVTESDTAILGRAQTRLRGKVVIVMAGANPAAQAAAAAAVGASAVVLARPGDAPLPAMAAGRAAAPVVGVTGDAAEAVLKLKPGTKVSFGAPERAKAAETTQVSPNTAQGPSAGGLPKPDLAAPGSALAVGGVVGGSAIAAARVAAAAAALARERPELTPLQLRAAVIANADPKRLPPERAGAGELRPGAGLVTASPPTPVSGPLDPISVKLQTTSSIQLTLRATSGATVSPQTLTLRPGAPASVSVRLPKPGATTGRLEALDPSGRVVASVPWLVRPDTVAPIQIGPLQTSQGGRRVRFTLGAFQRGAQTRIQVAERLVLDLVDGRGNVLRSLTFPGGARELMPAEYAYTLPRNALPKGDFAFRARAWAPRQEQPTTRESR